MSLTAKHPLIDLVDDTKPSSPHKLPRICVTINSTEAQDRRVQICSDLPVPSQEPTLLEMRASLNPSVFGFRTVHRNSRGIGNIDGLAQKDKFTNEFFRKLERRNRRHHISSALHYGKRVETDPPLPSNILVHLMRRSSGPFRLICPNSWRKCNSLTLDHTSQLTGGSFTHLQFDSQGVLLAVADSKALIRVYDFDEIQCKDMCYRRKKNGTQHTIPPILTFRALSKVSCLKWNPENEDELAISFTASTEMRIYNLASMDGITDTPTFTRLAPQNSLTRGQSISFFLFIPKHLSFADNMKQDAGSSVMLLTGGSQGLLILWALFPADSSREQARRVQQLWSINAWNKSPEYMEGISDLAVLGHGLVLIAGDKGSISCIDSLSCSYKAFSNQVSPTFLQYWYLPNSKTLRTYDNRYLGIRKMYAGEWTRQSDALQSTTLFCNCFLVTCGGWVIQINLDIIKQTKSFSISLSPLKILHRSPNSIYLTETEDEMPDGKPSYPDFPSPSTIICPHLPVLCVAKVKQTRHRMLDKDERTLVSSLSRYDQRQSDGILFIECKSTIRVDETLLSAFPTALDIHPTNHFIVCGVTDNVSGKSDLELLRINP